MGQLTDHILRYGLEYIENNSRTKHHHSAIFEDDVLDQIL